MNTMQRVDVTLPTAAENLALDQALLEVAGQADTPTEYLRLWEPDSHFVVLGRSSRLADEVDEHASRAHGIPVYRRASGGAAILTGPGCLMYAVVLSLEDRPALRGVDTAHQFVLGRLRDALAGHLESPQIAGTSDLTWGERKFSGNSLRIRRTHLLYHGTLLYDFDLSRIATCLRMPPRQPAYRGDRPHEDFLINLPLTGAELRAAVAAAWDNPPPSADWPRDLTATLARDVFPSDDWTHRR